MLLEAMSQYPASSSNPQYDGAEYPDDYGKVISPLPFPTLGSFCFQEDLLRN